MYLTWEKESFAKFSDLVGKVLSDVRVVKGTGDEIWFSCEDGEEFQMGHSPECCETVEISEVHGDWEDLIGTPILFAEESSSERSEPRPSGYSDSWTWTFYRIGTIKGSVTIRWLGESNGYYSEDVSFQRVVRES